MKWSNEKEEFEAESCDLNKKEKDLIDNHNLSLNELNNLWLKADLRVKKLIMRSWKNESY